MASDPPPSMSSPLIPPNRLWAEQLAMGTALLLGLLIFMACFFPKLLSTGSKVLTTNDLAAYGWMAALGIILQLIIHEVGALLVARGLKLPLRFRLFPFGANATAILEDRPREVWTDAVMGLAGPVVGTGVSVFCALVFQITQNPLFLGIACVGYFYNLFTLIPILDLEGGWIAPAIAPQAWFIGLLLSVWELRHGFNLVLLCVVSFAVPRLFLLLCARAPRTDLRCPVHQRIIINGIYFLLVIALAWFGSTTFEKLTVLIPEAMGD